MNGKIALLLKALLLAGGMFALQACFSEHYASPTPYGYGYGSAYGYENPTYAYGESYYGPSYYTPAPTYYRNEGPAYRHELHEEHEKAEARARYAAHETHEAFARHVHHDDDD